jgi:hypothetical protein
MTRFKWIGVAAMLAVAAACSKTEQPAPVTGNAPSASDARRADERAIAERLAQQNAELEKKEQADREAADRQRYVQAMRGVTSRWLEAASAASSTGRSGLPPVIDKMGAIIGDMQAVNTNDCTAKARDAYVGAMSTIRDAYRQFQQETGAQSEESARKLGEGATKYEEAERALNSCQ